ncbi:rho GTPase-activating protein 21 isoform X2 [Babesia caballi]|uniref:Rho GTPase-activating protein 21 isoform X2 n=1 Tax=Babesia caballi TaxID=5871 RepID=A0AAV4LTF3_BABCB|nr:rho GTPase-activating protein 21 isoform X2 [Babesia caballi]
MNEHSTHNVGNIPLKSNPSPISLKTAIQAGDDHIVKIEIDRSISSTVGPQDVLEALSLSKFDGDTVDVVVRGSALSCKFVESKTRTFTIGENPSRCVDITGNFWGTIFVSPARLAPHTAADENIDWKSVTSYKKFHKVVPFGCDEQTIPSRIQ